MQSISGNGWAYSNVVKTRGTYMSPCSFLILLYLFLALCMSSDWSMNFVYFQSSHLSDEDSMLTSLDCSEDWMGLESLGKCFAPSLVSKT